MWWVETSFLGSRGMKQYLSIFALVLILAVGALALWPISGSSSAAELDAESPRVFLAEMEGEVCASRSPVHTTSSLTAAKADSGHGGALPEIFLVMLEDGVCASLSPITISSRAPAQTDQSLFDQSESIGRHKAALGAETGVWYVQH